MCTRPVQSSWALAGKISSSQSRTTAPHTCFVFVFGVGGILLARVSGGFSWCGVGGPSLSHPILACAFVQHPHKHNKPTHPDQPHGPFVDPVLAQNPHGHLRRVVRVHVARHERGGERALLLMLVGDGVSGVGWLVGIGWCTYERPKGCSSPITTTTKT